MSDFSFSFFFGLANLSLQLGHIIILTTCQTAVPANTVSETVRAAAVIACDHGLRIAIGLYLAPGATLIGTPPKSWLILQRFQCHSLIIANEVLGCSIAPHIKVGHRLPADGTANCCRATAR